MNDDRCPGENMMFDNDKGKCVCVSDDLVYDEENGKCVSAQDNELGNERTLIQEWNEGARFSEEEKDMMDVDGHMHSPDEFEDHNQSNDDEDLSSFENGDSDGMEDQLDNSDEDGDFDGVD